MQRLTYKIVIRRSATKKNGENPLILRLILKRKVKDISTNLSCDLNRWNAIKQIIKGNEPEIQTKNLLLKAIINQVEKLYLKYQTTNQIFTLQEFSDKFLNIVSGQKNKNLVDLYQIHIDENKHKYSLGTLRKYKGEITKLQQFKKTIPLNEINYNFLLRYEKYMMEELSNKTNTIAKTMNCLKAVIHTAMKKDILQKTPFTNYKIKTNRGNVIALNKRELKIIEDYLPKFNYDSLKITATNFLFCCYTGLRFSDLMSLTWQNIDGDFVKITMHKSKTPITIPLIKKAKDLLPKNYGLKFQSVFRVYSNQVTNRYLKDIGMICQINKPLKFHMSRHTFATIGLDIGIPPIVISRLLGHTDLRTTMIYAETLESTKQREMNKWNKLN